MLRREFTQSGHAPSVVPPASKPPPKPAANKREEAEERRAFAKSEQAANVIPSKPAVVEVHSAAPPSTWLDKLKETAVKIVKMTQDFAVSAVTTVQNTAVRVVTTTQSEYQKFQTWNSIRKDYGWTPIGVFSQRTCIASEVVKPLNMDEKRTTDCFAPDILAAYMAQKVQNSIRLPYMGLFLTRYTCTSQQELNIIADTGKDISTHVDRLSPGNGQAWVKAYLPAAITKWPLPPNQNRPLPLRFDRPMGLPGMVILNQNWADPNAYSNPKSMPLTHEMGHVWDAHTGKISLPQGIVGGVADQLNTFIGGTVVEQNGSRFADRSGTELKYIPTQYQWTSSFNGKYGNNSTADYLCETFNALIYKRDAIPTPPRRIDAGTWVETVIKLQANALSPSLPTATSTPQAIPALHAPSATPDSVTLTSQPTINTTSSSSTTEALSQTPESK